jgi:hypothetical protein
MEVSGLLHGLADLLLGNPLVLVGGLVGRHRDCLNILEKRRISYFGFESNSVSSSP